MSDVLAAIVDQLYKDDTRIKELETENAALLAANRDLQLHFDVMRDDFAAAVVERDELRAEHGPRVTQLFEALAERDQLRARLAAIDNAPTVAFQDVFDHSDLYWRCPDPAQVKTRELIARPAKEES